MNKNYCDRDGMCTCDEYPDRDNIGCVYFLNKPTPFWCMYEYPELKHGKLEFQCTNAKARKEAGAK